MPKRISGENGLPTPRLLAAARTLAGISQRQLAQEAGLNTSSIGKYEAGLTTMKGESFERVLGALRARGIRFLGATATTSMGLVVEKRAADPKESL